MNDKMDIDPSGEGDGVDENDFIESDYEPDPYSLWPDDPVGE